MTKTISMHPLVKGISPSEWARYSDARRSYENRKAIRESAEKPTPGPWRAKVQSDVMIARVYGPKHADGGDYAPLVETTNHADAHLISAAPELLEQLRTANVNLSIWHSERSCTFGIDTCSCPLATNWRHNQTIIQKAEGRTT